MPCPDSVTKMYSSRYWAAKDSFEQVDLRVRKCLFLFACTNSCANPLIYGVFRDGWIGRDHFSNFGSRCQQ